jgi:hypothetical protein
VNPDPRSTERRAQASLPEAPARAPRRRGGARGTALGAALLLALPLTALGQPGAAARPAAAPELAERGLGGRWVAQGPGPIQFAQVENVFPDDEAVGAVHTVAADPTDPDVLYAGTVNGGIWKTTDATAVHPHWSQLTDAQASLSIGALEFDPVDSHHRTLVAGIGRFSSYGRFGGPRSGLLRTTNAGHHWTAIYGGGVLVGKDVSGVAARGSTLVVAVDVADAFTYGNIGIWRSTDGGASFTQIAVGDGTATGLPGGVTYDLVGDPLDPTRLYTSVVFADGVGGLNGVYRSDDTGATWTKVSDAAIDALLISGVTSNVEFAVGRQHEVYAAIADLGRLAGLFRSGDGGATWTALDLPATVEDGGVVFGIHPGGQASIHLSIVADPTDPEVVYVGGDRQPAFTEGTGFGPPVFPNSIGANNYSGRLFRVDASKPAGSQAAHLTHRNDLGAPGGGTASDSSPHADSREMVFDAAGNIIETDDGGIYRRTSPRTNAGDWFSLNGDLEANEQHDSAFDTLADVHFSGNQDNGTTVQNLPGDVAWSLLLSGDGGDVAVETRTIPGVSVRFSSAQGLQAFNRTFWDAGNNFLAFDFPPLTVVGGGAPIVPWFTTPVEVNAVDASRLVIGAFNSVYESFDQGFTVTEAGPGIGVNGNGADPVAYGGAGNADALYVGSGDRVFVRTAAPPAPLLAAATFPGSGSGFTVRDVVLDPTDAAAAYVVNSVGVFRTLDAGATWSDLTGNLPSLALLPLRSIAYVSRGDGLPASGKDVLVVGASNGVFYARQQHGFTVWKPLGTGFPTVIAFDLHYDAENDLLSAATLGRGSWTLRLND